MVVCRGLTLPDREPVGKCRRKLWRSCLELRVLTAVPMYQAMVLGQMKLEGPKAESERGCSDLRETWACDRDCVPGKI